jgi:predicted dehydrogenase
VRTDADSPTPIRWGILATGKIARIFASDLALTPGARLAAVGSRSLDGARAFAAAHGDGETRAHASYDELLADPDVDVVYVATPHSQHHEVALRALAAGKHVLCEKPLTLRAADTEDLVRAAREHDRFLMEAMWMACHPVVRAVRDALGAGRFGAPRRAHADLGFLVPADPEGRMLNPALGGGALLDMGIYPLTFAHLMFGEPEALSAQAILSESGVDLDVAIAGRYPGGVVAALTASMTSESTRAATITTDRGRIEVGPPFHHPSRATFVPDDPAHTSITLTGDAPVIGIGYGNEIAEVGRCLRAGLRESPLVPHAQTVSIMRQMDTIREQVGVHYPGDPR